MIADTQTQEFVVVSAEVQQPFFVVQDMDLAYVGGGSANGGLF